MPPCRPSRFLLAPFPVYLFPCTLYLQLMPRPITIKDYLLESRLFMGRSVAAMVFCGLLVMVVLARMVYLQVIAHDHFTTLSDDNRVKIQPIAPNRGLIYDRNGILLAENLPAYRLEITPEQVPDMDATLAELGKLIHLRDEDLVRFEKQRRRIHRFEGVPLRFRLSEEEVARFAVNRHRFPGVDVQAGPARFYPLAEHAVHVLGYVGRIDEDELQNLDTTNYRGTSHMGKIGVEKFYESQLHGTVGVQQVETNAQGRVLRVLERTPPIPGQDLYLSLDSRLQGAIEAAFGEFKGAAVAMDPKTGAVLAMVSLPGYDPNPFVNGIGRAEYQALQTDPARPLFNRALRGQYPPGSTLKPFIGLGGLETRITSAYSSTYCPGYYTLPGHDHKYRDWKRGGHGTVNLSKAIIESCDVYFYDLALSMGIDRIHGFLDLFSLGKKTGIDLTGERAGLSPSREWKRRVHNEPWFPGETLISGIGQGFNLTTPLQLATVTATLANRGQRMQPRILHAAQNPGDRRLIPTQPLALESVPINDPGNWQTIINAMTEVVHGTRGTARRIGEDAPYRIAGKTGTAQVFGIKQEEKYQAEDIAARLRDHALFIAFAPVDEPKIALAVVVENGGSGGSVAAPIARKILDAYLLGENDAE